MAYLLRLWQAEAEEGAPWRASVESPQTGERRGFSSLAELWAFLENEIAEGVQVHVVADSGERGGDIRTYATAQARSMSSPGSTLGDTNANHGYKEDTECLR